MNDVYSVLKYNLEKNNTTVQKQLKRINHDLSQF